jgi:hypothetical protein
MCRRPTWAGDKPTWIRRQPTWAGDRSTWMRRRPTWAGDKSTWMRRRPKWAGHDFTWAEDAAPSTIPRATPRRRDGTPAQRRGSPVHPGRSFFGFSCQGTQPPSTGRPALKGGPARRFSASPRMYIIAVARSPPREALSRRRRGRGCLRIAGLRRRTRRRGRVPRLPPGERWWGPFPLASFLQGFSDLQARPVGRFAGRR